MSRQDKNEGILAFEMEYNRCQFYVHFSLSKLFIHLNETLCMYLNIHIMFYLVVIKKTINNNKENNAITCKKRKKQNLIKCHIFLSHPSGFYFFVFSVYLHRFSIEGDIVHQPVKFIKKMICHLEIPDFCNEREECVFFQILETLKFFETFL